MNATGNLAFESSICALELTGDQSALWCTFHPPSDNFLSDTEQGEVNKKMNRWIDKSNSSMGVAK